MAAIIYLIVSPAAQLIWQSIGDRILNEMHQRESSLFQVQQVQKQQFVKIPFGKSPHLAKHSERGSWKEAVFVEKEERFGDVAVFDSSVQQLKL